MTTNFDTDPNTQTVAAAWASSPLGQPEREVRYGFAAPDSDDSPAGESFDAKRAVIAAALASGVIAGSALGVMLFDFSEAAAPTVVVPRSEGRLPAAPPAVLTETHTVDAPWLYSIARNEALRRIRERRREEPSDDLPDDASGEPGPEMLAARTELADLIADAAGGLSDRDRTVLELAFRHGLDGPELADALGVSPTNANTLVHRLRGTIERSLGALLVSRRVRNSGGCPELATILEGWDGQFNVLMRKRISRHIESCETCDEERRRLVSPVALLGATPVFIPAPEWLRDRTLSEVELTSASESLEAGSRGRRGDRGRSSVWPATAFVAALIAALGATLFWLNHKNVSITPTEVSQTVPVSSAPAPPPPSVAPPPPPPVQQPVTTAPPTRRTTVVEPPPSTSPPAPPVAEPPPPPPPPEEPTVPPVPEPPVWPPPGWPEWPPPDWPPPPPPGGGDLTGRET